MKIYKIAEDYRGQHTAPDPESSAPLHDLTQLLPDDIYGNDALRLYGTESPWDHECISIIQRYRNRPNARVKIYRAVPDQNVDIQKQLKPLRDVLDYQMQYNFFPMNNNLVDEVEEKIKMGNPEIGYDDLKQAVRDELERQYDELWNSKKANLKINPGDWVTISKGYARDHGLHSLNDFKITEKTVPAKTLYNNGDSIAEWSYVP